MVSNKNSNEFIKSNLEYCDYKLKKQYVSLAIKKSSFNSNDNLLTVNNILKNYCNNPDYYTNYNITNIISTINYDIIPDKLFIIINLLDEIKTIDKNIKYMISIKYVEKDFPFRIKINNKGKKIFTINATKFQSL